MTRKFWCLLALAVVLGSVYAYYFTDLINTPRIQIIKSDRPIGSPRFRSGVLPIAFTLDGRYDVTAIQVFAVSVSAEKAAVSPLWHLVAPAKPVPLKGFVYGQPVRGMQPMPTNSRPQRLEPGADYRLVVQAGRARGELGFRATVAPE